MHKCNGASPDFYAIDEVFDSVEPCFCFKTGDLCLKFDVFVLKYDVFALQPAIRMVE